MGMAFDFTLNRLLKQVYESLTSSDLTSNPATRGQSKGLIMIFNPVSLANAMTALKGQGSDDNSSWTDLPGGDFSTTGSNGEAADLPAGSADNGLFWYLFLGRPTYKYYRWMGTVGGGTNTFITTIMGANDGEGPKNGAGYGGETDSVRFLAGAV